MMTDLSSDVDRSGYAVARGVVSLELMERLCALCAQSPESNQTRRKGESVYGVRHLLTAVPALREIVGGTPFIELARVILGENARPVKGVFFDKTPDANWLVPYHQDVTITVAERREVAGFEMRPVKDGLVHVIPPLEVSEGLLALRIHLDDAGADHGALRVIPGSHRAGRLSSEQVQDWMARSPKEVVSVAAGDVMLMRPLLLHASSACQSPEHRRVIHIEYSAHNLPGGLEWAG